jgi:hypothetical protein
MKKLALLLLLCLSIQRLYPLRAADSVRVVPLADEVGQFERFEAVIEIEAEFENPYDPADIRVDVEFVAPTGRVIEVPGFYYEDFHYQRPRLTSTEQFSWRVRFTPQEIGTYRYRVAVTTVAGSTSSEEGTFTSVESDLPGFVRVDSRNPRYFAFDNGESYIPIGLNMSWSRGVDTIGDYQMWLDALDASGGNYIRVWMAPWDMNIEWTDTGLGDYGARQSRAYSLDQVLQMAEQRGIYIMLSLLNHGQFVPTDAQDWKHNPYNSANGGPCDIPECFATDPEAIRYWEQRLRYIVARWGYSPNIMSWEWWNEVNWTPLAGEPILAPWIERNTALLDELDPYDHLVTHSGSPVALTSVWSPLDFTQDHYYDRDDIVRTFANAIPEWHEAYPDKPFLVGEFGQNSGPLTFDTRGVEMRLGIWAGLLTGGAGTGMSWWWDTDIHPNNLWDVLYKGVSAFFTSEDMGAHQWRATDAEFAARTRARVFGLQADDTALVWVVSRDFGSSYLERAYLANLRNRAADPLDIEFPEVAGAALVVNGLQSGAYTVEVWDTLAGTILETQTVEAEDGSIEIALPTFTQDLALKIKPRT